MTKTQTIMKHLTSLLALLIASATIEAATVSVTMNATAKTMTLTPAGSSTAIAEDSHEGNTYVFNGVANGDYVIEGFNTTGISNGTLNIHVADEDITLQLWLATSKATNTNWVIGTDYTAENLSIRTREGGSYTGTIGYSTAAPYTKSTTLTALVPDGGSFNVELVPNAAHQAEGYMSAFPSATFTANAPQNMAIPLGGEFTCTCPADAELMLFRKPGGANGTGSIHYVPFITIEPTNVVTSGDVKTLTYRLANACTYNIRTWRKNGLTNCTKFAYSTDATKCPVINYTDAHYTARDPKWIDHDPTHNDRLNAVDILININKEGHKRMSVGEQYDLVTLRDWQIIPDQTSNYFFEPDYHYAVYDLEGNPDNSVVEVVGDGVIGSQWAYLRAKTPGTAIVTVTFDAACATQWTNNLENDYYGGRYYSALWPENTAVFVVTVGDGTNAIVPNMLINEDYNLEGGKMSWKYLDAEHDVLYYINDEEYAEYTFTPSNVTTVDIAYPTIRTNDAVYDNGWESVAANGDGSYTLHLVHGSQIVRMGDGAGHYAYQVIRAKHATRTITNMSTGSTTVFRPGDEVKVQYNGLFHPANKLSGIYNMSAYITYNGVPTGTALILGSNQYWFAGTPSAQAVTVTIPYDYTAPTFDLTEGVIQINGYGDQIGNHRNLSKVAGRSPNFTATVDKSYFGALPDISFPVTQRKVVKATINVVPAEANVTIKDEEGNELTAETDGTYLLKEGTTSLYVQYTGYKREIQSIVITNDMPDEKTFDIALTPIPANGWDGKTTKVPTKSAGIYLITSGYELAWFAAEVQKGTTTIAYNAQLVNDIDLCGYNWTPIADVTSSAKAYKGTFDGNNKTIKNLLVERSATRAGLFAYIQAGAKIENLTVEGNVVSTAANSYAAGIVGHTNGACTVTNCVNKATVNGVKYVSGIAGYMAGKGVIDRCTNYGDITATGTYAQGIAYLYMVNPTISNCCNHGTILGDNNCGGIYNSNVNTSVVTNVYNTGYVHASGENASGYSCHGAIRPTTSTTVTTASVTNAYANQDFLFNELSTTIIEDEARWQSGEVAYLLGDAFGQEIGVDPLPVIGGKKVYKIGDGEETFYSNTPVYEITEGDNNAALQEANGDAHILLKRDFEAGVLYTLCLPFSMTEQQVSEAFGAGTEIWYLNGSEDRGSLIHIDFARVNSIEAGVPYLFRPTEDFMTGTLIENVTFENTTGKTLGAATDYVQMHGFVNSTSFNAGAGNYFLGEDDYLHQLGSTRTVPGLRVYFTFGSAAQTTRRAKIVLGGQVTTSLENEIETADYQKIMRNGQLLIQKGDHLYNMQGQLMK